jgi:histidinol dehydrogenase
MPEPAVEIARLDRRSEDFETRFGALLARAPDADPQVSARVCEILDAIRTRGDAALLEYTNRLDRRALTAASALELPASRLRQAWDELSPALRAALDCAAQRIRDYAERQKLEGWEYCDGLGNALGVRVTALDRVGIYVPGGRAAYPSSVLMNAIPARVAGVGEIVMCVPAPQDALSPAVLAAAHRAGVDRVFTIGGAQAIAALAYGTATVPAVDKIVGPGNAYVAAAKRLVFGRVGIDSIAGPSEIVIVSDGSGDPRWLAMDLFAQAEHDEDAQSILISPDAAFLERVAQAMNERIAGLPRAAIVRAALRTRGALIAVGDLEEAFELVNRIAPEHLQLALAAPRQWLAKVRHAGAIFLGQHTPEAFGDYCAGPNHVLPTARAARYASPLGTYEFQKRSSLIECAAEGAAQLAPVAARLADAEGLAAHAASARDRQR